MEGHPREYADVVIVGSGPAGATHARVITDAHPDATVLLVDAGPLVSRPPGAHVNTIEDPLARSTAKIASQGPTQWSYGIPTPEERDLAAARDGSLLAHTGLFLVAEAQQPQLAAFPAASMSNNVGGMGAHWFGCCPRPSGTERVDFIDVEELERLLKHAEQLLKVSTTQFVTSGAGRQREAILADVFDRDRVPERRVQPMPLALSTDSPGTGQSGPAEILGPLVRSAGRGFELRAETLCTRVLTAGDRAIGVELVDLSSGRIYEIRAGTVVVAADALRTPQLLFVSGIRPAALGRHLNEHPYLSWRLPLDDASPLTERDPPVDSDDDPRALVPPSGVTWIPFDDDRFPFQIAVAQWASDVLVVNALLRKDLDPDDRISFSESQVDWRGLPAMRIDYSLTAGDRGRAVAAQEAMVAAAEACAGATGADPPELQPSGTSLHYQGTVRMGVRDDGDSVCDRHGRVWTTENLVVAGNGVIPTSTACNPTLTTVALAVLGAEEVARTLRNGAG